MSNSGGIGGGNNSLRIKYEIPLPWALGVVAVVLAQAATVYFGQVRQGELISQQSDLIRDLTAQVRALSVELGGKNLKDVEHDIRLQDHERRIQHIEAMARTGK